jgi:hypothetical protein
MNRKVSYLRVLIGFLVLLMAAPPWILAQDSGTGATFRQEELDQMLAPIALYPDSLLGQILVAATYPDQVREADQWVRQNSNLQGDELNAALDGMDWDLSVKALVPFPQVLSMMSDKMDWTQRMGDAFLAQQEDVMDTIQRLRAKAHAQGNLNTTEQQKVVVRGESIEIEPANPRVVYVPTYNPTVIYGSWWHPAYPPYAYNPYYPHYAYDPYYTGVGFVTAGLFGFAAGIAVGSVWNSGWGHWDWGRHNVNVNINRNININRNDIGSEHLRTSSWHDVNRQRGSVRSGREGAAKSGKAALKTGARPTAGSVQKGLQQREGKAQVRKGKTAGSEGGQAKVRSDRGKVSRGKAAGKSSEQVSRSKSSGKSSGKMSGSKSSGKSRGDSLRDGGSSRGGSKSHGGGKSHGSGDGSHGGGKSHGGGGSHDKHD